MLITSSSSFLEFTVTLKPRLLEGSRYSDGSVTYQVDFIHENDRILTPSNLPDNSKVYGADAVVGPLKLRAKGPNFGSKPLKFEFVVNWGLKNDSCGFPGCIIDSRSRIKEEIPVEKEIQSSLVFDRST